MNLFSVATMRLLAPRDVSGYPSLKLNLDRIAPRPAFQRALAKADPGFAVPLS
jgi:glutathione S-transferase